MSTQLLSYQLKPTAIPTSQQTPIPPFPYEQLNKHSSIYTFRGGYGGIPPSRNIKYQDFLTKLTYNTNVAQK